MLLTLWRTEETVWCLEMTGSEVRWAGRRVKKGMMMAREKIHQEQASTLVE